MIPFIFNLMQGGSRRRVLGNRAPSNAGRRFWELSGGVLFARAGAGWRPTPLLGGEATPVTITSAGSGGAAKAPASTAHRTTAPRRQRGRCGRLYSGS